MDRMMRRTLGLGMLVIVAGCAGENDGTPAANSADLAAAKQYIVVLKDGPQAGPAMASAVAQAQGITPTHIYQVALPGFVATLDGAKLEALRNDPRVSYIEEDRPVSLATTQTPTANWGLDRIDQVNLPLNNSYTYTQTGAGVHFYGIDTGILPTHVDVAGRMGNGFTSIIDGNGTVDCNGHGTHTATTAGGTTFGVAKGMTIHPVRVLNCGGSGTTAGVIQGIDWVTANRILPAVANMSLGGSVSVAENQAVANSIASGVVYAVSAGNNNVPACTQSPASEPLALTVGATNKTDKRANFSNFGTCVDLFAPGVNITAGWIGSNTATAVVSGTSMASPLVAGVAGLYLQANPTHTPAQVSAAITNNATPNKVTSPGVGSPNKLLYMGFLNTGPGNQAPVANFTYTCVAATHTCTLDSSTSTDDVGIVSRQWKRPNGQVLGNGVTLVQAFPAAGTFNITLTVTDGGAPPLSNSKTIAVVVP
jgi:subtilisin family serine protease